jgi:hypothetical protein
MKDLLDQDTSIKKSIWKRIAFAVNLIVFAFALSVFIFKLKMVISLFFSLKNSPFLPSNIFYELSRPDLNILVWQSIGIILGTIFFLKKWHWISCLTVLVILIGSYSLRTAINVSWFLG